MQELIKILQDVTSSTTVKAAIYSGDGRLVAGEDVTHAAPDFSADVIYSDGANGATAFKFAYSSAEMYGVVNAAGTEGRNYAAMLLKLIEGLSPRAPRISKREYFKRILCGDSSADEAIAYKEKYALPDGACYAVVINFPQHIEDAENLIVQAEACRPDCIVRVDGESCAMIRFISDEGDYQSAAEYCDFLAVSIFEELGAHPVIGVGGQVENFGGAALSFAQATTAVRMCKMFSSKGDVHTYKEYLLIKMLEDIPENRKREYMRELIGDEGMELFDDEEMTGTAEEFLSDNLNVSETSRKLYMHRNTLMYRLDKIERLTGLNIRKFSDAVAFRMLTIMHKLLK